MDQVWFPYPDTMICVKTLLRRNSSDYYYFFRLFSCAINFLFWFVACSLLFQERKTCCKYAKSKSAFSLTSSCPCDVGDHHREERLWEMVRSTGVSWEVYLGILLTKDWRMHSGRSETCSMPR